MSVLEDRHHIEGSFTFKVEKSDNGSFVASVVQETKHTQLRDDVGALYYVVAVIFIYGCSILMMIASYIRKNKIDRRMNRYLKEMATVRKRERQLQLISAAAKAAAARQSFSRAVSFSGPSGLFGIAGAAAAAGGVGMGGLGRGGGLFPPIRGYPSSREYPDIEETDGENPTPSQSPSPRGDEDEDSTSASQHFSYNSDIPLGREMVHDPQGPQRNHLYHLKGGHVQIVCEAYTTTDLSDTDMSATEENSPHSLQLASISRSNSGYMKVSQNCLDHLSTTSTSPRMSPKRPRHENIFPSKTVNFLEPLEMDGYSGGTTETDGNSETSFMECRLTPDSSPSSDNHKDDIGAIVYSGFQVVSTV